MRYRLGACLCLVLACTTSGTGRLPAISRIPTIAQARDTVYVDQLPIDNAELMYRHFDAEYLLCMEGENPRPNYLHIVDFRLAHVTRTTATQLWFDIACEVIYPRTVATLHNHRDITDLSGNCSLSQNDILTFLASDLKWMVVQCGPRKWGFFRRNYVERNKDVRYLPAAPGMVADFTVDSTEIQGASTVDGYEH